MINSGRFKQQILTRSQLVRSVTKKQISCSQKQKFEKHGSIASKLYFSSDALTGSAYLI